MILEWVIDSLLLFSVDPYEYDWHPKTRRSDWTCVMHIVDPETKEIWWGRTDRPAMRQFRATRAKLRLVCKAWKTFADSPSVEHRCVRLCMISPETDPLQPARIIKAKRLEVLNGLIPPVEGAGDLVISAIEQIKSFSAEIILDTGGMFTSAVLCNLQHLFPHLRALFLDLSEDVIPEFQIRKLDSLLWKLDSLTCLIMRVGPFFYLSDDTVLQLPHLRTLSISSATVLGEMYMDAWELPSLEHLEFGVLSDSSACKRLLDRHGQKLRYLSLYFSEAPVLFGSFRILHNCPHLLYLGIPLASLWTDATLQTSHPLLRLVNTATGSAYSRWSFGPLAFFTNAMRFCATTPRLQTITDDHSWVSLLPKVDQDPEEADASLFPDTPEFKVRKFGIEAAQVTYLLSSKLDSLGIRYEDREFLTVEQGKDKLDEVMRDPKRARKYFPH